MKLCIVLEVSWDVKKRFATLALLTAVLLTQMGTSEVVARNHLKGQQSAYLKRAATQSVDWYPWGRQAFTRAKELHRPILLDVGAIWCPWCELMDRETYTNPKIVEFINRKFVAVKVDFDTSPSLVAQIQRAQAVLNLPVGLPLTSFLTPEGKLYFGAGYLPSEAKMDKQSFKQAATQALKTYSSKEKLDEELFQLEVTK